MFSMSHLILEPNWWLMWAKSRPFSQCCFSNVRGLFLKKIIVSIACCTANLKLVSLGKSQKFFPPNFQSRNNQGPKVGEGGSLEPWSPEISAVEPGALSFYWLEPWSFLGSGPQSPKTFCAEPGARSPAFSSLIIRVSRLHWFLITAFLCLFVRVNGHKETESEERTVHNTSIRGYLSL